MQKIMRDLQEIRKATLEEVVKKAKEIADGHFTILSFTGGYKGFFGTPDDIDKLRCYLQLLEPCEEIEHLYWNMLFDSLIFTWDDDIVNYATYLYDLKKLDNGRG